MKRNLPSRLPLLACILGATLSAAPLEKQVVQGHLPAEARLRPIERLASTRRLHLAIGLPLRNRSELTNFLEQLYDPSSADYHQYLTSAQFAERFGPTEADYQRVEAFAKARGLTVTGRHTNRLLLDVSGTVSDIEKAFGVNMRVYRHPTENRTFFAPDTNPTVESGVPVLGIAGLDDFHLPRPMDLKSSFSYAIAFSTPYATGSGPNRTFLGRDFRAAYAPGLQLDGSGQSVGLFELDGYYTNDITTYESLADLPAVTLTNVLLNGFSGAAGSQNDEVALDIVMAVAMAPGLSRVIVYEGSTPNDVLNQMAVDNQARQLSCSWGFGSSVDLVRDQIFQQFAAQGQSMFQASGDLGAWTGPITAPSDNPFVTVVGGTVLTTTGPGGAWSGETTWFGSGGGISTSYPIPSWQRGATNATNQSSATMRNVPDVACLADHAIWLVANNGQQGAIGGTSAAAPLWAGFTALVNQQAAAAGKSPVGFINPAIYAIGSGAGYGAAFHDITTGSNKTSSSGSRFIAMPGYDLCTGWGTPSGSNLINALLAPADALKITPGSDIVVTGPVGGPFNPNTTSYILTNSGTAPLNWSLVNTSAWLNVSPASGTLSPAGAGATLAVTLSAAISNFSAGQYSATLWFTNLTDGYGQSRLAKLAVVTPPTITSQPSSQAVFEGASESFSVGIASNAQVFYQWQFDNGMFATNLADGGSVFGSASGTLTVNNTSSTNVGAYSVVVSNAAGAVVSSNAFLTIVPWRPVLTLQPVNQTALPGETIVFTASAVGSQPLQYRWRGNGTNLSDSATIFGAATSNLTLASVSTASTGTYSVVVSNALGSVASTGAVLSVNAIATSGAALASLYSFTGGVDGASPNGLMAHTNGILYGTTQSGGTNSFGSVFQVTTNGALASLYAFTGASDGATPQATLLQAANGNLYGTAFQAGTNGYGTAFQTSTNGGLTTLCSFDKPGGILPIAGLAQAADGSFYGTAYEGGTNLLYGTVFRLSPDGTLSNLYSFTGGNDGGAPYAGLVRGADGSFYGTTYKGGRFGSGTIFKIDTNGLLTTLVFFNGTNGNLPYAGLTLGSDGDFFGATSSGGSFTNGTVFRMTPGGALTTLYSFSGGTDGGNPAATLLQGSDGNFYGSTCYGGAYGDGTLFVLTPTGTVTTLATFDGYNGANPQAALVQGKDTAFYGTTPNGGADGSGTILRLTTGTNVAPQITEQPADQSVYAGATAGLSVAVLGSEPLSYRWQQHGTNLVDGGNTSGTSGRTLVFSNITAANAGSYSVTISNNFGSTSSSNANLQVLISPPFITAQPTNQTVAPGVAASFSVTAFGDLPLNYQWRRNGATITNNGQVSGIGGPALAIYNVTEANNGIYDVVVSNPLNSVTSTGAVLTVIPVSAAGTRVSTLHSFGGGDDGGLPNGLVQGTNGSLFGTTEFGGSHHFGTVFSLSTNGLLTTMVAFDGSNGGLPLAGLTQGADGNLYGTTQFGGSNFTGNIFVLNTDGALTNLYSFSGASDGTSPATVFVQGNDGNFYGTTTTGGLFGEGSVFRVAPDGTFTNVYSFTGAADGADPTPELSLGPDGAFYGLTTAGAAKGYGGVFHVTPAGLLTNLYSFKGGTDGYSPAGGLALGTDGNFYGVTMYETIRTFVLPGTIFRVTTNGTLTTVYSLSVGDGANPAAGLIQGADGNFYGTTYYGGAAGNGTVFRISPAGGFATLLSFDGFNDGAYPQSALVQGMDGNLYGSTSSGGPGGGGTIFRLAMTNAPQITTQPANQTVALGGRVTFSLAAFGAPPLAYQWRFDGTNLSDGVNVAGSNARVLTINNAAAINAGTYSVVLSNALGSVTSTGAVLTVLSPPVFQNIKQINGMVRFTWSTIAGQKYQLQYKPELSSLAWTNLGSVVTATGTVLTNSDGIGTNPRRFYRAVLLP